MTAPHTSRRGFLLGAAGTGAGLALSSLAGCTPAPDVAGTGPFRHGVASGDPDTHSVVLWTRTEPTTDGGSCVELTWQVATDDTFTRIVSQGTINATAERDWTAKVIAGGLDAGRKYHYRFIAPSGISPVGRTKTTPTAGAERLRLGVVSCSNYGYGNFYAYRNLARRTDLDAIVHLGDYLYEYASQGYGETYGDYRPLDPPHEILTLEDYRRRYALYRRDPDLAELHRQFAMIHSWDDHEFADDPYVGGAANHQPAQDGDWATRVANALRAYDEWMPTRLDGNRIFRTVEFSDLARLVLVDRQRRFIWPEPDDGDLYLGREQFDWLDRRLAETRADWLLLGTGTTFGSTDADLVGGGWGRRDRSRVFDGVAKADTDNLVVLSGDTHRALALTLVDDPAAFARNRTGTAGIELSCGSITSPGSDLGEPGAAVRWNSGGNRSYLVLDINRDRMVSEFYGFGDLSKYLSFAPNEDLLARFTTATGSHTIL